jgi:hypothetical protein
MFICLTKESVHCSALSEGNMITSRLSESPPWSVGHRHHGERKHSHPIRCSPSCAGRHWHHSRLCDYYILNAKVLKSEHKLLGMQIRANSFRLRGSPEMFHIQPLGGHMTTAIPQCHIILWAPHFQVVQLKITIHDIGRSVK